MEYPFYADFKPHIEIIEGQLSYILAVEVSICATTIGFRISQEAAEILRTVKKRDIALMVLLQCSVGNKKMPTQEKFDLFINEIVLSSLHEFEANIQAYDQRYPRWNVSWMLTQYTRDL